MIMLGTCHQIIAASHNNEIQYNSSSPDEKSLLNFCRFVGYELQPNTSADKKFGIKQGGTLHEFQTLHLIEFSSERKRMTVVVKNLRDNKIFVYCKGADCKRFMI